VAPIKWLKLYIDIFDENFKEYLQNIFSREVEYVQLLPGLFFEFIGILLLLEIDCLYPQDVHSDRQKRRITEWIFTVYRRNLSFRITGRFFARKRSSFFTLFIYFSGMMDYGDVFTPVFTVYSRLRPFSWTWVDSSV
jgi:hypothetical protein